MEISLESLLITEQAEEEFNRLSSQNQRQLVNRLFNKLRSTKKIRSSTQLSLFEFRSGDLRLIFAPRDQQTILLFITSRENLQRSIETSINHRVQSKTKPLLESKLASFYAALGDSSMPAGRNPTTPLTITEATTNASRLSEIFFSAASQLEMEESRIAALEGRIKNVEVFQQEISKESAKRHSVEARWLEKLEASTVENRELAKYRSETQEQYEELKRENDSLQAAVTQIENRCAAIEEQADDFGKQYAVHQSESSNWQREIEERLDGGLNQVATRVAELNGELSELLTSTNDLQNNQHDENQKLAGDLEALAKTVDSAVGRQHDEFAAAHAIRLQQANEIEELKTALASSHTQTEALRTELQAQRSRAEKMEARIDLLSREIDRINSKPEPRNWFRRLFSTGQQRSTASPQGSKRLHFSGSHFK